MPDQLTPTLEDYLRTIYHIERKQKVARPRDISRSQHVASSTVTAALQSLADKEMINYEPYELITLTDKGRRRARQLVVRHNVLQNFLQDILGLEGDKAETTTCNMEHAVDREALERFACFLVFIERHSPSGVNWLDAFRRFLDEGANGQTCKECVQQYMADLRTEENG